MRLIVLPSERGGITIGFEYCPGTWMSAEDALNLSMDIKVAVAEALIIKETDDKF